MEHESHLPPFAIRPRFKVALPLSQEEIDKKINKGLAMPGASCTGISVPGFATIKVPRADRHYWSPQLSVTLEDQEEGDGKGGVLLHGLYGPAPAVWTMFVFFYAVIGVVLMFVTVVGLSRQSLDMSSAILWWVPVLLFLLLSVYLFSYFGQKLGHDQMESLHLFLEKCLGMDIEAVGD